MNDTSNRLMMTGVLAMVVALVLPVPADAQVLSGTHAESAGPVMGRAAGMPLRDGALAAGMLTVRIVEGAFTNNLSGLIVRLEVAGRAAQTATTGADGRAQFAHLPVGSRVRASATVNGAQLLSEEFEMPAESGVRVLLVAGEGSVVAERGAAGLPANHPPIPAQSSMPVAAPATATAVPAEAPGVVALKIALVCSTIVAALFIAVRRRRPR